MFGQAKGNFIKKLDKTKKATTVVRVETESLNPVREMPKLNLPKNETLNLPSEKPLEIEVDLKNYIVTQLETGFWLTGSYPFQEEIERRFQIGATHLKELETAINATLRKRDLPPYYIRSNEVKEAESEARKSDLDPLFVVACNLICDTLDKRAKAVKLKAVGLTTKRWQVLLEDKKHQAYYSERVNKAFGNASESAKIALVKNVEAGDLQSLKYYHEFSREFDPNKELTTNLLQIIAHFMEILVKHVSPQVVEAVSYEFEEKLLELNP